MRRRIRVTVQQVCALAALTVRKHKPEGKNPIGIADLEWILALRSTGSCSRSSSSAKKANPNITSEPKYMAEPEECQG